LASLETALLRAMEWRLQSAREEWRGLVRRLSDPGRKLREHQQRLDDMSLNLVRRFRDRLRQCRDKLARATGRLEALSPLACLERGYSITHKLPEERIVKDGSTLNTGDRLRITFTAGKALCRVEEKE
ncbi:MAG TPA: exodeoxyribonuclease VII large subunit, partial [Candidatus Binatia bacterium]|nr:exodeoxyribonuclease VII large subunit [Candidatus Binatia bacterium]